MSTFGSAKNNLLRTDVVPSMPQLLDNSKPVQTRTSESTVPPPYPETAYQWLVKVLDGLIDFGKRHGHYGVINLSEGEYQWLMDDVLEELICSVGEDENHPLAPLMDFIIRLIANYEQTYVPKLTERFPELAEETPIEASSENSNPPRYASELSDSQLAAHGFFSIGCLLWEGGKAEKALSAYDKAIRLQPDYAEVYNNRGNIKNELGSRDAALDDYDKAIRLNPNFAEAYSNRGSTKFRLGKHDKAFADLNKAIRLQPDFINAYINRGVAQLGLGNIDEAKLDFQTALELAEHQENDNFKTYVEKRLQELNAVTPQGCKG
ncbi:MAG: tetratricopeptide repeat protein [Candidatus Poribacteria bacterium]|nr:tetratricopeptide repeat protein [Candidatus Poribacteria bacterium]